MADGEIRTKGTAYGHATRRPYATHGLPSGAETDFLIELGRRLHDTRTLLDMSRRELARRSGISERYLAEIEAGRGNVSIVLLLRIIGAIRLP